MAEVNETKENIEAIFPHGNSDRAIDPEPHLLFDTPANSSGIIRQVRHCSSMTAANTAVTRRE